MSEVNLDAYAASSEAHKEANSATPMQELNLALQACGFGRFHLRLLFSVMLTMTAGVLVSNTTPYLLPIAECDLKMGLVEKGILNAAPFIGMTFSSIIAGFLTDAFGRRVFIISGNFGIFLSMIMGGTSQSYKVLIIAKFLEGFLYGPAFSATVTMTSEFGHDGVRDRIMLCQSSLVAFAQVIIALMSWGILISDWKYEMFNGMLGEFASSISAVVVHSSEFAHKGIVDIFMLCQASFRSTAQITIALMSWGVLINDWRVTLVDQYIVLNTWNFYIYLMSLWSLASCIAYYFLPESPKYLVSQQKYDEARRVLINMYTENTGKPPESYPYVDLWKIKNKEVIDEAPEIRAERTLAHQIVTGLHNVKPMFQKPLIYSLLAIGTVNFLVMFTYNVLRLWFPQLSTIVEHYLDDSGTTDLCDMLDAYTSDLRSRMNTINATEYVCVPTKSGTETYVNSIIFGTVCLIPYLISGVLVNRLGKKTLQICAGVISVFMLFGLKFSNTKVAVVALFSVGAATTQMMMSLTQAMTVQLFPTTTRTLAIALNMTVGRIGTMVGNITFPILLNIGCVVPFYTLVGLMIGATFVVIVTPTKKK